MTAEILLQLHHVRLWKPVKQSVKRLCHCGDWNYDRRWNRHCTVLRGGEGMGTFLKRAGTLFSMRHFRQWELMKCSAKRLRRCRNCNLARHCNSYYQVLGGREGLLIFLTRAGARTLFQLRHLQLREFMKRLRRCRNRNRNHTRHSRSCHWSCHS